MECLSAGLKCCRILQFFFEYSDCVPFQHQFDRSQWIVSGQVHRLQAAGDSTTGLRHLHGAEGSGHVLLDLAHSVKSFRGVVAAGTERVAGKAQDPVFAILKCFVQVVRSGFRRLASGTFPFRQGGPFLHPLCQDATALLAHGQAARFAEHPGLVFRHFLTGFHRQFQHPSCPAMRVRIHDELKIALQMGETD